MKVNRNICYVFGIYFVLFAALAVWIIKFAAFDAQSIIANPYNPRVNLADSRINRGKIFAYSGEALAEEAESEYRARNYPHAFAFAHPLGFSGYNSQGVESLYSMELLTVEREFSQRIKNASESAPIYGNDIVLTLDYALQSKAYELLEGKAGAVVVIEPSTGRILASAASPSFNPNRVDTEWEQLLADTENNPLLNRAAQGLYPPGSVFKIVTLAAAKRYLPDFESFTCTCEGSEVFDGKTLRCYNETAHGEVDYKSAFIKSCNIYFAQLGQMVGAENLKKTAEELLFNTDLPYPLEYVNSSFAADTSSGIAEMAETSIGQGKTLTTPLHMALLAASLANDGYLMQPYIVDSVVTPFGKTAKKNLPKMSQRLFSTEECEMFTEIMKGVVTEGTASRLPEQLNMAGKTGSAETASGDDHGWFVGFAPADSPEIAVAVLVENCGGSAQVLPLVEELAGVWSER
jgi:peptidoglycan glycosyltransferase